MATVNVTVNDLYQIIGQQQVELAGRQMELAKATQLIGQQQVEMVALRSEVARLTERNLALAAALKEAKPNDGKGVAEDIARSSAST